MASGLGVLGLAPAVFWSMTLKELDAALRGRLGPHALDTAPDQQTLNSLMQLFPDELFPDDRPEIFHG